MKTKAEARIALREAMVDYLDVMEEKGFMLGGPKEDFYDENGSAPVCDCRHGNASYEISVGPLEMAEENRSLEQNRAITAWKNGRLDSLEAWNLYAATRKIQE